MTRLTLVSAGTALILLPFAFVLELGLGGLGADPGWAAGALLLYALFCGLATLGGFSLAKRLMGETPLGALWGGTFSLIAFLALFAWIAFLAGDAPEQIWALVSYLAEPGTSAIGVATCVALAIVWFGIGMTNRAKPVG